MNDAQYLLKLSQSLKNAGREGADKDEPEGARYIRMSDTLAGSIARRLERIAHGDGCRLASTAEWAGKM